MKSCSSVLIGLGIGAVLGYIFGIHHGDLWIGGSIAVTASIAVYGLIAYPLYRSRWSGHNSKFWYSLIGVLAPALMFFTPNSTFLADDVSVVVLLGCLWVGGVYAGVALAHNSSNKTDSEAPTTSQPSPSD